MVSVQEPRPLLSGDLDVQARQTGPTRVGMTLQEVERDLLSHHDARGIHVRPVIEVAEALAHIYAQKLALAPYLPQAERPGEGLALACTYERLYVPRIEPRIAVKDCHVRRCTRIDEARHVFLFVGHLAQTREGLRLDRGDSPCSPDGIASNHDHARRRCHLICFPPLKILPFPTPWTP